MIYRIATIEDCQALAEWNHQLIPDEGHRNPMDIPQLKERMRGWMTTGGYTAVIFEENGDAVAYAVETLINQRWPKTKRLTVEVLTQNRSAVAFWRAMGYRDYSLALEIMPRN